MTNGPVLGHMLKRSVDALQSSPGQDPEQDPIRVILASVSTVGAIFIVLTCLVFGALLLCVRYTLFGVVATLAQVEAPESNYVPLDNGNKDDDPSAPLNATDPEVVLVQAAPVTGSIRRTLRHLHARAGFFARWRGAACAVVAALVHALLYQLAFAALSSFLPFALASLIGAVLTSIVLARWYMAWTHIVISEPSDKAWFRRVPTFATWKKIWAPTAINALASHAAFLVPALVWFAFGFQDPERLREQSAVGLVLRMSTVLLLALVTYIAVVLPSEVALTRCQASMLPEDEEGIVPFDRSYGGKVVPAIIGGTGMLSFVDAWKSFDAPARIRLVKLYLKIFAVDLAIHLVFTLLLTAQVYLFLGDAAKKIGDQFPDHGSVS